MKSFLLKYKFIDYLILISISLLVYNTWFFTTGVLTSGDWQYFFEPTHKDFFDFPRVWTERGVGQLQVDYVTLYIYTYLLGLFSGVANLDISQRILIFYVIPPLAAISSYILIKELIKNRLGAFIGSLFFCYNTYFLTLIIVGHVLLFYGFVIAPLLLFFIIKLLKTPGISFKFLSLSLVTGLILSSIETRVFYIMAWVIVIYTLFFLFEHLNKSPKYKFQACLKIGLFFLSIILVSLYWVVPLANLNLIASNNIFNRELFGNQFMTLLNSISLYHPFWTGSGVTLFQIQPIKLYYFALPCIAFFGFILNKSKNKNQNSILFAMVVAIIGIFLTKQVDEPFSEIYPWLREHVPGFSAFREASKFFFLIALGYSVLIGSFFAYIYQYWKKGFLFYFKYIVTIFCLFAILQNVIPLMSRQVDSLFVSKEVPQEYNLLADYLSEQPGFFRTLWMPSGNRWSFYDSQRPSLRAVNMLFGQYDFLLKNRPAGYKTEDYILDVVRQPFSEFLLSKSAIKYVIVPAETVSREDNVFLFYGGLKDPEIKKYYIQELDKLDFLEKIDAGIPNTVIYENKSYSPKSYFNFTEKSYSIPSVSNLDKKYNFISSELEQDQEKKDFNLSLEATGIPQNDKGIEVNNIFEKIDNSYLDFENKKVEQTFSTDPEREHILYENSQKVELFYSFQAGTLSFSTKSSSNLSVDNYTSQYQDMPREIFSLKNLAFSENYILDINNTVYNLSKNTDSERISTIYPEDKVKLYKIYKESAISNPSFEDGLWEDKVRDCNAFDSNSQLDMNLSETASDGQNSLQLEAATHIACTVSPTLEVETGGSYIFNFDYQSPNAQFAGYYFDFGKDVEEKEEADEETKDLIDGLQSDEIKKLEAEAEIVKKSRIVQDRIPILEKNKWFTFQRKIVVPDDIFKPALAFYAYSKDGSTNIINRYDNLKMNKINLESNLHENIKFPEQKYKKIPLTNTDKNEVAVSYNLNNTNLENIIPNPSFEEGTWEDKVRDCNAYDNLGDLQMNLDTEETSEGKNSLEFVVGNHLACTGTSFELKNYGDLFFSFKHKSSDKQPVSFFMSFNDKDNTSIKRDIYPQTTDWETFSELIEVPPGANVASLYIYGITNKYKIRQTTNYDQFQAVLLPKIDKNIYLVSKPQANTVEMESLESMEKTNEQDSLPKIQYTLANSTKKRVDLSGVKKPFILNMSEGFNPEWSLYALDTKSNQAAKSPLPVEHVQTDFTFNSWYIDPEKLCEDLMRGLCQKDQEDGYSFSLIAYIKTQDYAYMGLGISIANFLLLLFTFYVMSQNKWLNS